MLSPSDGVGTPTLSSIDSNKFVIDYKVTHRYIPYFEVADVYVDKDTDERQARYRVGFKYKF